LRCRSKKTAVNLSHRQAPLPQLASRPVVAAAAGEVIERVLVLGEDEQFHVGVGEDAALVSCPLALASPSRGGYIRILPPTAG
jgi:hypothetical protein